MSRKLKISEVLEAVFFVFFSFVTSYEASNSFHFLCLANLVTELNDLNIHGENPASCSQREILLKCLTRQLGVPKASSLSV